MAIRLPGLAAVGLALGLVGADGAAADCLDRTFAANGWSLTPVGRASALVQQPDGKLVVAGVAFRTPPPGASLPASDVLLVRYDANGVLDATFGVGGIVQTPFGAADSASATALALQPDGKLVAAGGATRFNGIPPYPYDATRVILVRYDANGVLDPTFGSGGRVDSAFPTNTTVRGLALQPDGGIAVAGSATSGPFGADQFFFASYAAGGTLDPTFGTGGSTVFGQGAGNALARQPDGKLVSAGVFHTQGIDHFALARVDGAGLPDVGFGTGGVVVTDATGIDRQNAAEAVIVQPDGRIVAAGYGRGLTLVRYENDGTLDAGFGSGGVAGALQGAVAFGVTLAPDGTLVVAGDAYDGLDYNVAVARFTTDGALDPTFGGNGFIGTDFNTGADDVANGVVVAPDGTVVVAGSVGSGAVLLARYLGTACTACAEATCPAPPACEAFAGKNRLRITRAPATSDLLRWSWTKSIAPVSAADLGHPEMGLDGFDLQLFDGSFGGRMLVHWPYFSGGLTCDPFNCWKVVRNGLDFKAKSLGLSAKIRTGVAGKGRLDVRFRHPGIAPVFPLTPPVEIRFMRGDGRACWVSTFGPSSITKNFGQSFDAH